MRARGCCPLERAASESRAESSREVAEVAMPMWGTGNWEFEFEPQLNLSRDRAARCPASLTLPIQPLLCSLLAMRSFASYCRAGPLFLCLRRFRFSRQRRARHALVEIAVVVAVVVAWLGTQLCRGCCLMLFAICDARRQMQGGREAVAQALPVRLWAGCDSLGWRCR